MKKSIKKKCFDYLSYIHYKYYTHGLLTQCYLFTNGIKNLISWFSIIWKDQNWDYSFLLKILRFKINNMIKCFEADSLHSTEPYVKQMKFTLRVLDRIIEQNYMHPDFEKILDSHEDTMKVLVNENEEYYTKEQDEFWNKWSDHWETRDKELLFKVLQKHIEKWWV